MSTNWRISTFNGVLLTAYFVPTWTIAAFKIMVSPIHGLYERPNIALGLFMSDFLHTSALNAVRFAWLLALGKLTVVAFFAVFIVFVTRVSMRTKGDCDEPLAMALMIGSIVSFGGMVLASKVGEVPALRLHATELLLLLGTAIVMCVEPAPKAEPQASSQAAPVPTAYPLSSPNS